MAFKFSFELVDAAKGSGDAIRKKEESHRMGEVRVRSDCKGSVRL